MKRPDGSLPGLQHGVRRTVAVHGVLEAAAVFAWVLLFASFQLACADEPDSALLERPAPAPLEPHAPKRAEEPAPAQPASAGAFAHSGACTLCHAEQAAAWSGSHHDLAIQPATPDSVLGDFDETVFEHFGVTTRFFRDGDGFRVETEGADGLPGVFEVAFVFGVDPLQQYLIDLGAGKLHALTVAWDTRDGAWFSLYPDERIQAGDPLHFTGRLQRWNTMCAECHSTALRRGYSLESDAYDPSWAELDVGCQACHGPAEKHVAWAHSDERGSDNGLTIKLASDSGGAPLMGAEREVEVCAPCHSRRHPVSGEAVIGEPFLDHYMPSLLLPPLYHADGQVLGEVYVYGSFTQSLMHRRGVRCSDCHEPHSLVLRAEGDRLCLQCHSAQANPRFPTLAGRSYDTPAHHFHPEASAGARCVACHMPEAAFMVVDGRRDHSLRIPRPDLSERLGTPNACTGCHEDRSSAWAAQKVESHRASSERASKRPPTHYGEALHAGLEGEASSVEALLKLAMDTGEPAIARATALELLPDSAPAASDVVRALLLAVEDSSPIVRATAVGVLERYPSSESLEAVLGALSDDRRAVRIEAARVLGAMPEERLESRQREALARAIDEFRSAQLAVADTPGAHLNLGVLSERQGHSVLAEESYQNAVRLAPEFIPARVNLANLFNRLGRNEEAEQQLRAALATVAEWPPADGSTREKGELHYSLGLLLAETGRLPEAEGELARAAADLPDRARVRYNHGLALQQLGRSAAAERAFLEAESQAPSDPAIPNALAILYLQAKAPERALPHAARAYELTGSAEAGQLLASIRDELAAPEKPDAP